MVAVVGDGAMTGGVAFEAVTQAGGLGTPIVVLLNDNGMSIAPNVGALSRYFNRVRLNPEAVARARGHRGRPDQAPGAAGPGVRAARSARQGVDQGVLGPGTVVGGARLGLHGRHRRPRRARCPPGAARSAGRRAPGRRSLRDRQGQGLRAGRGRRSRGHGEVARGQAPLDRQRRPRRPRPNGAAAARGAEVGGQAAAAAVHPGVRRGAVASAVATSA